jgi:Lysozyme like domain
MANVAPSGGGGCAGQRYTYAQLQGLWINAGGSAASAALAAAIAEAESSGCSTVTSSNPDGGTNVGLWQLDTPGGKGAGHSVSELQQAATNAKVAVAGSGNGTNWSAWATYGSGAYKAFLSGSTTPDLSVSGASGVAPGAAPTAANQAACLMSAPSLNLFVTSIGGGCVFEKTQARALIAAGIIGWSMVVGFVGLILLASATGAGGKAASAAGHAAEGLGAGLALVPGAEPVGLGLAAAGAEVHKRGATRAATSAAKRTGQRRIDAQAKADRATERAARPAPQGRTARRAAAGGTSGPGRSGARSGTFTGNGPGS